MIKRLSILFIIMLISTISYQQNPLNVNFSTTAVPNPGQPFDVDVRVSDFDDLLSFQIFILWDSTVLEIDTIPFVTSSLPDFDDSAITLPSETASMTKGNVRANWFSFTLSPQSLPDDHLLFTMRFNPIGSDCDTTSIKIGNLGFSMNEAIDDNGEDIGVVSNSLLVTIPGADCGGGGNDDGIGLIFSDEFVAPSTNVCFPMTTMNMDSISTFQGSAMWDPTVLSFTGVQEFGLPGLTEGGFNLNNTDSGVLTYVWFDLSGANPASIPDGGTIFEICFDVIGALGETSIVKAFDGTPPQTTSIQISGENGVLPYYIEEGLITVADGPPMFFTIEAVETTGCNGDEVCVDFITENFDDIAAFQLTMTWDSMLLKYNRVENLNTTLGLFESFFNLATAHKLRLSWSDASTNGITLPDGTLLYTVCYDVVPDAMEGESTEIEFIDDSFPIEIINGDTEVIPYTMIDGTVTVGCAITVNLVATQPSCFGSTNGAITANISGGTSPYMCQWFKNGNSTGPPTSGHTATCVLAGQTSGMYMVVVTDSDGNSVTQSIELGPDEIVITGTTTPTTCSANGTIDFMVSGGTGAISTSFSPTVVPSSAPAGTYILTATDANGCTNTASFTVMDGCSDPIEINTTIVHPTECNACGMVTVVCSGGSGNFTVSYSPAIFDLNCVPVGNYMVTCTDDSGASLSTSFMVIEEMSMPINTGNIEITPADCNISNGTVNYNLTGGCGALKCEVRPAGTSSYVDCSTITTYAAGDYELLVTDTDGNTATANFTVTTIAEEPLMVTVNSTTGATCEVLGTVNFTITGGCNPEFQIRSSSTPPVIYNTTDNLPPGSYTIRVSDDTGTVRNALFTIADESGVAALTASVTGIQNAPCPSGVGTATLSYSGGCEPVTCKITRDGTAIGSCMNVEFIPGVYVVTYTGNMGSVASQTFTIGSDGPAIVVNVDSNMDGNVAITASAGTAPYTYLWMFPNGTTSNSEDLSNLTISGEYMLVVTDSNGCTEKITVTVDTGGIFASGVSVTSDFDGFGTPCASNSNPCEGEGVIAGTIVGGAGPYTITITNQSLEEFTFSNFPLTGICAGSYDITISDSNGLIYEHPTPINVSSPDPIVITLDGQIKCEDEGMANGAIETMVSGGAGGYTFSWTPSGSNGADNLNIAAGMYILTVEDANLCTEQMLFEVRDCKITGECYEAISVISPNNDGINDQFIISCAGNTDNTLSIFNRFGKTVYETSNYNNDWSGTDLDGTDLVEGAYYWVLQLSFNNGDSRIVKGTVTLLRN